MQGKGIESKARQGEIKWGNMYVETGRVERGGGDGRSELEGKVGWK